MELNRRDAEIVKREVALVEREKEHEKELEEEVLDKHEGMVAAAIEKVQEKDASKGGMLETLKGMLLLEPPCWM